MTIARQQSFRKKLSTWLNHLSQKIDPPDIPISTTITNEFPNSSGSTNCGDAIFDLGWRQGSFIPEASIPVAEKCGELPEGVHVIVCSQSCTVVSPDLKKDPYVELIVGHPVKKYNHKSPEATGKDARKIHLKVRGIDGVEALEFSINNKFEATRDNLLRFEPLNQIGLVDGESRKLTNWLARNYLRIALPNALVEMLREHLFPRIESWMKRTIEGKATPAHFDINTIFMSWEPDEESSNYKLKFIFIGDTEEVQRDFVLNLMPEISSLNESNETGFEILVMECMLKREVSLEDIDGYHRLSQFDYLTSIGEWHNFSS